MNDIKQINKSLENNIDKKIELTEGYIKLRDLKKVNIKEFDDIRIDLVKGKSKGSRGNVYYRLVINFTDRLTVNVMCTKTQYYLIVDQLELADEITTHSIYAKIRIITGKRDIGRNWIRFELFVVDGVNYSQFLSDEDSRLFLREQEKKNCNYKIIESNVELKDDEIQSLFDKAFSDLEY